MRRRPFGPGFRERAGEYEDNNYRRAALDEYPFNSTIEGGGINYAHNRVSVRPVRLSESNNQGRLMGGFYADARIRAGDAFGVLTFPDDYGTSYWIRRDGTPRSYT
jgi:hypothetical protein